VTIRVRVDNEGKKRSDLPNAPIHRWRAIHSTIGVAHIVEGLKAREDERGLVRLKRLSPGGSEDNPSSRQGIFRSPWAILGCGGRRTSCIVLYLKRLGREVHVTLDFVAVAL
jgi:hypothetical protein